MTMPAANFAPASSHSPTCGRGGRSPRKNAAASSPGQAKKYPRCRMSETPGAGVRRQVSHFTLKKSAPQISHM
jgi:hypothetical protein